MESLTPTRSPEGAPEAPLLALKGVTRVYGEGEAAVKALDGVDLTIERGEFVAITGASGSGKSTCVSIMGLLELPSGGEYFIEGVPVQSLPPDVLAALRNARFGFIFQSYNLLSRTSALENVALPLVYAGVGAAERTRRAKAALEAVGLGGREDARSNQLSGGQQQRVAIARALVNEPEVILADEPTGNLDSHTGTEIMELISKLNHERGITVVMVTHDPKSAAWAARKVVFSDGHVVTDAQQARAANGAHVAEPGPTNEAVTASEASPQRSERGPTNEAVTASEASPQRSEPGPTNGAVTAGEASPQRSEPGHGGAP